MESAFLARAALESLQLRWHHVALGRAAAEAGAQDLWWSSACPRCGESAQVGALGLTERAAHRTPASEGPFTGLVALASSTRPRFLQRPGSLPSCRVCWRMELSLPSPGPRLRSPAPAASCRHRPAASVLGGQESSFSLRQLFPAFDQLSDEESREDAAYEKKVAFDLSSSDDTSSASSVDLRQPERTCLAGRACWAQPVALWTWFWLSLSVPAVSCSSASRQLCWPRFGCSRDNIWLEAHSRPQRQGTGRESVRELAF